MHCDLVLLSMSRFAEWQHGTSNRAYHITRLLRQHEEVQKILLVDFLPHTFKRSARVWIQDVFGTPPGKRLRRDAVSQLAEIEPGKVFHYATIEPYLGEPSFVRSLRKVGRSIHMRRPLLWSYVPTYVRAFQSSFFHGSVFDAVDDWSVHPSYSHQQSRMKANYRFIGTHADLIFAVSPTVLKLFANHPHAYCVPNGVDVEHFRRHCRPQDSEVLQQQGAKICYSGVIQNRFDAKLVGWLAEQRPEYQMYFLGPIWPDANVGRLRTLPNVHFIGRVPYQRLPAYLQQCDVGIVPHKPTPLVASMDPLKTYEYVAAGLPVVGTNITPAQGLHGVAVVDTREEFLHALDAAVRAHHQPHELQADVQTFDWSARFSAMWGHVQALLTRKP